MEKEIKEQIEYYHKKALDMIEMDEDLKIAKSIMGERRFWLDHEINYSWGCNSIAEIKELLKAFAKAGIKLEEASGLDTTSPTWKLKGKNCVIRLNPYWYSDEDEGRTCRLVKVGEETHTYPKFKLMCDGKEVTAI